MNTEAEAVESLEDTEVVLIAMELGSLWPTWARGAAPGSVVIAQQPAEPPWAFARRVTKRISKLWASRCKIRKAVVAVGPASDVDSFSARCIIARSVVGAMPMADDSEVVLSAHEPYGSDLRHELLGLAGALSEQLQGTQLAVSVRFDTAPRPLRKTGARRMPKRRRPHTRRLEEAPLP
jgi:hypothetical protein